VGLHVVVLHLDLVVDHLGYRVGAEGIHDLIERRPHVGRFVTDHRQAKDDELAMFVRFDLGHGNVEAISQPILDALQHLPFVFERPRVADEQSHTERTYDHQRSVFSVQFSVAF
jgi:hypothetical protein